MNTLLNEPEASPMQHRVSPLAETEPAPAVDSGPQDREFTLGTSTILGLFFALALLCAVFFAFGYSLGSKRTATATSVAAAPVVSPVFTNTKPAPGSPFTPTAKPEVAHPAPLESVTVPVAPPSAPAKTGTAPLSPAAEAGDAHPGALPAATPATPIVQVAAVSHQEDAELIASTLKRRGYAVTIRTEPQDKLLHIQLGPFPNKKDAEAMRQRLLADGFNAYVK